MAVTALEILANLDDRHQSPEFQIRGPRLKRIKKLTQGQMAYQEIKLRLLCLQILDFSHYTTLTLGNYPFFRYQSSSVK
jgi:hypothetical protein